MNTAFYDEVVTKSFVLISWDVGRPGLWLLIEPYLSRTQIKERSRIWPEGVGLVQCFIKYKPISKKKILTRRVNMDRACFSNQFS